MGIYGTFKRLLKIPKQLSFGSACLFVIQLLAIVNVSLVAPVFIRYWFVARFIELREPLDFVFSTCMDELSGVCSYPQADVYFDEREIGFASGNTYGFQLEVELFDDDVNKQLGIFMAQLQTKDSNGTPITTYKKPVTFREPSKSYLKTARNLFFWPLWIIGYFNEPPSTSKNIVFTNQFVENSRKPTSLITIQLQHRYIQVNQAYLKIQAFVGLSSYLFTAYPISTYLVLFLSNLVVYLMLFSIYWAYKGLNVVGMVLNEEEEPKPQNLRPMPKINTSQDLMKKRTSSLSKTSQLLQHFPLFNRQSSTISRSSTQKTFSPKRSPSPAPITIKDEQPECPYLENIPGWNVVPDRYRSESNSSSTLTKRHTKFNSRFFE